MARYPLLKLQILDQKGNWSVNPTKKRLPPVVLKHVYSIKNPSILQNQRKYPPVNLLLLTVSPEKMTKCAKMVVHLQVMCVRPVGVNVQLVFRASGVNVRTATIQQKTNYIGLSTNTSPVKRDLLVIAAVEMVCRVKRLTRKEDGSLHGRKEFVAKLRAMMKQVQPIMVVVALPLNCFRKMSCTQPPVPDVVPTQHSLQLYRYVLFVCFVFVLIKLIYLILK